MKLADLVPGRVYLVKGYSNPGLWLYEGETTQQLTNGFKQRRITIARMRKITETDPSETLIEAYEQERRVAPQRGDVEEQSRKIASADIAEEYAVSVEEALAKRDAEHQARKAEHQTIEETLDRLEDVTGLLWRHTARGIYAAHLTQVQAQLFIDRQRALQS
jgi:hypothetical protein